MHKVQALTVEKMTLIKSLRDKYLSQDYEHKSPVQCQQLASTTLTPKRSDQSNKRMTVHSPTPRKCKKPLQFTPKRKHIQIAPKRSDPETAKAPDPPPKRLSVQLFTPSKIKVLYKYIYL
jgi:hypothetical protein